MGTAKVDLNELQVFARVAESRSFTLAAQRLDAPKSSVSRAIRRLESRLGVRLVERTTRSVTLTEAGELYLERCQRVLEEAEQADLAVGALLAKPRGRLRVGASLMFMRAVLAPALTEFLRLYPEIRLSLVPLTADEPGNPHELDVMIRAGTPPDSLLAARRLKRIRIGAYASPTFLKQYGAPQSPADLRQMSCITTNCGTFGEAADSTTWTLRRGAEVREVRVESRIALPDPLLNHQLAVAGVGIALLSHPLASKDVEQKRLVRVLPEWEPEPVDLHVLYAPRLSASPKVRVFLQFLREITSAPAAGKATESARPRLQAPG